MVNYEKPIRLDEIEHIPVYRREMNMQGGRLMEVSGNSVTVSFSSDLTVTNVDIDRPKMLVTDASNWETDN